MSILRSNPVRCIVLVCVLSLVSFVVASVAVAVTPAPRLTIHSLALPTHFSAADSEGCLQLGASYIDPCDVWQVTVTNSGSQPAAGPVILTDALPAGLNVHGVLLASGEGVCEPEAVPVRCEFFGGLAP